MKKLLILAVVLLAAAYFLSAPLLKWGIESGTKRAFGTDTKVDSVVVDWPNERMDVNGFAVNNPIGFDYDHFMALDKGYAVVNLKSLADDAVEVREISVSGMHLYLENTGSRVNFQEILAEMAKRSARQDTAGAGSSSAESGEAALEIPLPDLAATRYIVRNLHIGEGKVHVKTAMGEAKSKPLPAFTLTDVGADSGGVTLAELSNVVTRAMVDSASSTAGFEGAPISVSDQADSLLNQLKSVAASVWEKASSYWDPIGLALQKKLNAWSSRFDRQLEQIKEQTVELGEQVIEKVQQPETDVKKPVFPPGTRPMAPSAQTALPSPYGAQPYGQPRGYPPQGYGQPRSYPGQPYRQGGYPGYAPYQGR
jgi:hypothetical protein